MVDYDFYVNSYLGSTLPETAFTALEAKASALLEQFKRLYVVESPGKDSEGFAVCAMAESLYEDSKSTLSAATMGSVSVRYSATSESLRKKLLRKARIYLDIYRGVG